MVTGPEERHEQPPLINDEDILNDCGPVEIPPPPALVQSLDASGPRLIITQIVTENFKSYGGIRVMGPFHRNFTCIIGPNGSGKSNVIDSMLFVFGYRASKVRSKKVSQLIHKSELVPNANNCMVSVHFQKIIDQGPGATDYEVVPDSQFIISRRAYTDNTSYYLIDDHRAVYRDVANLLRSHGIDIDHNRFLILQGEVEQIALMKPKAPSEHEDGFLEYLEDIIGSSRFKKPLNIFADRIEKLNDLRLEKLARVKAVEKEKDELEGVRNEAMNYLRLVNQLILMKNVLYQQKFSEKRELARLTKEKLTQAKKETEEIISQIQEKNQEISRLQLERDELTQNHTDTEIQYREERTRFAQLEAVDSQLRDERKHIELTTIRLIKNIDGEEKKLEGLKQLPDEINVNQENFKKQLTKYEEMKRKHEKLYEETVDSLAKESAPLRIKVKENETVLGQLQAEADQIKNELSIERVKYNLMLAGQRRESEHLEATRKDLEVVQNQLKDRENQLNEVKEQLASTPNSGKGSLVTALASATRDLAEVEAHEADLIKETNNIRKKLTGMKCALQAENSKNRLLKAFTEAKRSGILPGIIGRLGDLGAIPPRYDVAISTACGALDHFVTDTMDTAQKAVTFLKENNLGRATFIALDKMEKWAHQSLNRFTIPKVPFEVYRLYDLVETVDPVIKPAFYFALRNTLVTNDLDAATQVAFGQQQRYRTVTLQGQLIEVSGAMSGGGGHPISGRIATDISVAKEFYTIGQITESKNLGSSTNGINEKEVSILEKQLTQSDNELSRLRETHHRLNEMIMRLTCQRRGAEKKVELLESGCVELRDHVKMLIEAVTEAEKRVKQASPSDVERQKAEKQIHKLEKLSQQKNSELTKKSEILNNLKNEVINFGSDRLSAVQKQIDTTIKEIRETDEELTKLSVKLKTNLRNQQKLAEKIQDMQTELESLQKKMISVDEKLREVEKKASISMDSYQKLQAQIEEIQQQLKMNHTKLTEAETNLTEIKKAEVISHRLVNQLEGELSEANTSVRHWEREIRNLKLHHIDDEDEDDGVNNTQTVELSPSVHQIINNTTNVQVIGDYENSLHQQESSSSPSALRIITQKSEQLITNEKYKSGKVKSLPKFTDEELKELSVDKHEMQRLEERISSMSPNMAAIEEYRRKAQNYLTRVSELNHITSIMGEQRQHLDDAKSKRLSEFLNGFHAITNKLKEMYQMITQGGDAELELIDSLDPFSEGIVFSVRPPKKSWKSIANLSGGEKTLSSLALVFALHHYKPTPLYVMDEIDAALDFKNVSIIGNYLKERTKNAQFIVISLRNNMFELSDRLVGIYKTYNITKTITLDPSSLMNHLHSLVIRVATEQGYKGDLPSLLPQSQPVSLPPASSQQHTSQTTIPGTQRILQTDNTENHETIVLDSCVEETILVNGDHDDDDDDDDMQTELGMIKDIVGSTAKLLSISNNNDDTTTPTTTDNNNSNNNPASVVQY